ncbi:hypothetical protein DPMN_087430 [Dreissena polymorpha]|uniref:Uncharacterized protein n=1 Tax=Dreissena polymorpha TaxID=45954 RepID=A0A9D4KTW3_DREPO|nr:hypothetical protein DPMN_087430 [Dreissena polymorpha]
MGPYIVEIDRNVIREVQYQFEVNRCRNEEIIAKGNFGWAWLMWRVATGLVMGPCIAEIDRIVIRKVYKTAILGGRGLFGRGAPGLVMGPCIVEIDRIVIREVRYQFEDNRCRNEEIIFHGSSAYSVGGDSGQDGQTDRRTAEITTISPRFSKSLGIIIINIAYNYSLYSQPLFYCVYVFIT